MSDPVDLNELEAALREQLDWSLDLAKAARVTPPHDNPDLLEAALGVVARLRQAEADAAANDRDGAQWHRKWAAQHAEVVSLREALADAVRVRMNAVGMVEGQDSHIAMVERLNSEQGATIRELREALAWYWKNKGASAQQEVIQGARSL